MKTYEDIKANCTACGNPVYLNKRENKPVCSVGKVREDGYIPLNTRCFEKDGLPGVEDL